MPFKIYYPALGSQEWQLLAARDGHGKVYECLLWLRAHYLTEDSKWDTTLLCANRLGGRRPYIECGLLDALPLKMGLSGLTTVLLERVCEEYGGRIDP
ncbi:hypothetical protein Nepgr_020481 [Nepenthes gracilis]|uniref:Uncharacterized protein n=1 Tax=Nepenthes gracilis TaxID=150966 RepID=A0AAD3SWX9_NEPGR|nr:hypothetical protein Nepgr_020481 [Nepenthes gracilis]